MIINKGDKRRAPPKFPILNNNLCLQCKEEAAVRSASKSFQWWCLACGHHWTGDDLLKVDGLKNPKKPNTKRSYRKPAFKDKKRRYGR